MYGMVCINCPICRGHVLSSGQCTAWYALTARYAGAMYYLAGNIRSWYALTMQRPCTVLSSRVCTGVVCMNFMVCMNFTIYMNCMVYMDCMVCMNCMICRARIFRPAAVRHQRGTRTSSRERRKKYKYEESFNSWKIAKRKALI